MPGAMKAARSARGIPIRSPSVTRASGLGRSTVSWLRAMATAKNASSTR